MKDCEGRRLGLKDCYLDPFVGLEVDDNLLYPKKLIIIPAKSRQGYLIKIGRKNNLENAYKFGLPSSVLKTSRPTIYNYKKPIANCCNSKSAIIISEIGKGVNPLFGSDWVAPIHDLENLEELYKENSKIFATPRIEYVVYPSANKLISDEDDGFTFIGYVGIEKNALEVYLWFNNERKKFFLEITNAEWVMDDKGMERVEKEFKDFQKTMMSLVYSKKVLDLLGD